MRVFDSIAATGGALRGCAVAIGNFDGVHLGHRRLFEIARERARARGGATVALTFEPHPVRVLRPRLAPPLLTPLPRKLELLAACGADATVVQPFDLAYAGTDAATFVQRDLAERLGAADVVVGHDFTAGKGRAGVDALRLLLGARGIELHVVAPVASDGLVVSSTKIREFLLEGNVDGASQLLGRPHDVDGVVEPGAARGRAFGFATANVRPAAMLPANGVYVVWVSVAARRAERTLDDAPAGAAASMDGPGTPAASSSRLYGGVCNVGVKPTVQQSGPVTAEAHLFEFGGEDLHGFPMRIAFLARLREERRFASVDALRAQIAEDVNAARAVLRGVAG